MATAAVLLVGTVEVAAEVHTTVLPHWHPECLITTITILAIKEVPICLQIQVGKEEEAGLEQPVLILHLRRADLVEVVFNVSYQELVRLFPQEVPLLTGAIIGVVAVVVPPVVTAAASAEAVVRMVVVAEEWH